MESEMMESPLDQLLDVLAERLTKKLPKDARNVSARLLTVEQAATYIGRTKEAVQHMVSRGKLPTVRTDRRVFIDRNDLDQWIEDNKA